MVNKIVEVIKAVQNNVGLVKYPTVIVGSAIALNKLRKWNKEHKSVLKVAPKKKASGVLFGKKKGKIVYSPATAEGHIAVFGGSGSGKTSAVLVPTLKSWTGTAFVIDISGDICKNVPDMDKVIYEPANAHSTPYNIFGAIDNLKTETERMQSLEELAFLLMPENAPGSVKASGLFIYAENHRDRENLRSPKIALLRWGGRNIDTDRTCKQNLFREKRNGPRFG